MPGRWLVVGVTVIGGRCHCDRWSVVCGRWLVGGRWFCTTPVMNAGNPTERNSLLDSNGSLGARM